MDKNLTILYSSYDGYQDLLPVAYHFYCKFCKNLKMNVYWGSNGEKIINFKNRAPNWHYINKSDVDLGWSKNLKIYLEEIKTDYVLLLLDDFLFIDKPDIKSIREAFYLMKKYGAVYIRLNDRPPADKKLNDNFGYIHYYSDYRSSLQPAIWDREILIQLCKYDFNPWLFEWKAGIAKNTISEIFLGSFNDIIKTSHCVEKGMWIDYMLNMIKSENLDVGSNRRIWQSNKPNNTENRMIDLIHPQILFHLRRLLKRGIFSDNFKGNEHK